MIQNVPRLCSLHFLPIIFLLLNQSFSFGFSFEAALYEPNVSLFVTYTTGSSGRIELTKNLLRSVQVNSPGLFANTVVACLDDAACKWCRRQFSETRSCYCVKDAVSASTSDFYASAVIFCYIFR
jgi:hypothetical protein